MADFTDLIVHVVRKDNHVRLEIECTAVSYREFFWHEYPNAQVALAMRDRIEEAAQARIGGLVQRAYEQGYRDGRGKQRKKDRFTSCINTTTDEVAW